VARVVIDTLKGGALLFAYYPDSKWLKESPLLSCPGGSQSRIATNAPPSAPRG
jgi:hypothetical protein